MPIYLCRNPASQHHPTGAYFSRNAFSHSETSSTRKQGGESREAVGREIIFGIEEADKGVEADEIDLRGRGGVFAKLSNGRGFVVKVWVLCHAHVDNRVCRCPNLFGKGVHHAKSLRELARWWGGAYRHTALLEGEDAFEQRNGWMNWRRCGFQGRSGDVEVCECGWLKEESRM